MVVRKTTQQKMQLQIISKSKVLSAITIQVKIINQDCESFENDGRYVFEEEKSHSYKRMNQ